MAPIALFLAVLALMPALPRAALCDDAYTLQSASQTLFTGSDPKNLSVTNAPLKPDLSDMEVLHDRMRYSILSGFEGSCTKAAKPVRFLERVGRAAPFTARTETGYHVVMYDSNTVLQGSRYDYWFAFYRPADTLRLALGRTRNGAGDFRGWYGFLTFEDSVRNPESGLWTSKGTQLFASGPGDSAALDSALMIRTGFRDLVFDQNRRGRFQLQFVRVSLENKPAAVRPVSRKAGRATQDPRRRLDRHRLDGRRMGAGFVARRLNQAPHFPDQARRGP